MPDLENLPNQLTVEITFTNKESITAPDFKAAIESALASVADDLSGAIFVVEGHENTGVVIGNG